MKWFSLVIYGAVIGHWLVGVKGRLWPRKRTGRYAVVAMHSMREEFYDVGRTSQRNTAESAANVIEEMTINYISIIYDLLDPADKEEYMCKNFIRTPEAEDVAELSVARSICEKSG